MFSVCQEDASSQSQVGAIGGAFGTSGAWFPRAEMIAQEWGPGREKGPRFPFPSIPEMNFASSWNAMEVGRMGCWDPSEGPRGPGRVWQERRALLSSRVLGS